MGKDQKSAHVGMVELVDSENLGAVTSVMDFWMISCQELEHDLLDTFSALGDLQYQYDWVITDHDLWYMEKLPGGSVHALAVDRIADGRHRTDSSFVRKIYFFRVWWRPLHSSKRHATL